MGLGVGTYSDGFGVAFTLLDQFSAVARKIESSMSSLTAKSTAFAGAMNKGLGYGYAPAREARVVANETIALASLAEEAAIDKLVMDHRLAASTIKLAEANETAAIEEAVRKAELDEVAKAAAARQIAIDEAMNRSNQRRAMEAIEARRLEMLAEIEAANAAAASAAIAEAANARVQASLVGLGAAVIGLALVIKGAKVDELFQKEELAIQGFVGSADKAHAAFMELQADANFNPMMGLENMLKTHSLLLSQNTPIEQSLRLTRNLSNMLTAVGRGAPELSRVGRELEKIAAMGHLTGRELNQAAAAGIPLRQLLEDYFGHALPNTLKDFPITIDDLDKALELAMRTGGRFSKAFEKMSESIMFQFARLKNEITYTFLAIGKAVEPITVTVGAALTGLFTTLKLFSQSWVGHAFWIVTTSLLAFTAAVSLATLGGKGLSLVLGKMAHGLGYATLKATLATEGFAATLATIGKTIGKTIVSNPMFKWFAVFAAGTALVTNATSHFKRVMEDQEAVTGGMTGRLQRLGGVLSFITEAFANYNEQTKRSDMSQSMVTALDKLGLHNYTATLFKLVAGTMELVYGMGDAFAQLAHIGMAALEAISSILSGINKALKFIIPGFANLTQDLDAMRAIGWVLGTIIIGVTTNMFRLGLVSSWAFIQVIAKGLWAAIEGFGLWAIEILAVTYVTYGLAAAVALATGGVLLIAGVLGYFVSQTNNSSLAMDDLGSSFSNVVKPIDEATAAMNKFKDAESRRNALMNTNKEIMQDWQNGNYLKAFIGTLKQPFQMAAMDYNGDAQTLASPEAINMPQVQQQQAILNTTTRTSDGTYPDMSYAPAPGRDIVIPVNIDGREVAKVTYPLLKQMEYKEVATRNA